MTDDPFKEVASLIENLRTMRATRSQARAKFRRKLEDDLEAELAQFDEQTSDEIEKASAAVREELRRLQQERHSYREVAKHVNLSREWVRRLAA